MAIFIETLFKAQLPIENSARYSQASGVGFTHACPPATARALDFGCHSSRTLRQAIGSGAGDQLCNVVNHCEPPGRPA